MYQLNEVSETALIMLRSRVYESQKPALLFKDSMGEDLLGEKITYRLMAESFHPDFRISGEWSYFEDPDIQPTILKLFRYSRSLSKTQYTVIAEID